MPEATPLESPGRRAGCLLRATALFLLLLSTTLAGCSEPEPEAASDPEPTAQECSAISIPAARAGADATYDVEGSYWMASQAAALVDWRLAGSDEGQAPGPLPAGTSIDVAVSDETSDRLDGQGRMQAAHRISYTIHRPQDPNAVLAHEEWVHATEGWMVQSTYRNQYMRSDGASIDNLFMTSTSVPWMLFAPLVWGNTLAGGEVFDIELEGERTGQFYATRYESYHLVASAPSPADGGCTVTLAGTFEGGSTAAGYRLLFRVTLEADNPWPISFEVDVEGPKGDVQGVGFRMGLERSSPGQGPPLPAYSMHAQAEQGLPVRSSSLPLADSQGIFPTDLEEALARIQDDPVVAAWLEDHSDARIAKLMHRPGESSSSIVDRWEVMYWSSTGGLSASLDRETVLGGLLEDQFSVAAFETNKVLKPAGEVDGAVLSLRALIDTYRRATGTAPEVLHCPLDIAACGIGTHYGTGVPPAQPGAESYSAWLGLQVDYTTGAVYRYTGAEPTAFVP